MPPGILTPQSLMFILEKEIFRASRYDLPFAALSFSVVLAKPKKHVPPGTITHQSVVDSILEKLTTNVRGADLAGQLGKNKGVALLPMTSKTESKFALRRHLRMLNTESVEIKGVPLDVKIAGVATNFEPESMPDAAAFLKTLSYNLSEMVARIKNIHQLV